MKDLLSIVYLLAALGAMVQIHELKPDQKFEVTVVGGLMWPMALGIAVVDQAHQAVHRR